MEQRDIVYILKNDVKADELRYSLRSISKNFPHRHVVFVGGCPKGIRPDLYIEHQQEGNSKWERAASSMKRAFIDDRISDEFFLFNDDFFVLRPIDTENFINYTTGTLERRVLELEGNLHKMSSYTACLNRLKFQLRNEGRDTLSFALHLPFLVDRHKAMELVGSHTDLVMFRSLYANYYKEPFTFHKDVKVFTPTKLPDFDDYLSTSDESFKNGIVGDYIRNKFPEVCRYEEEFWKTRERYTEEGDDIYFTIGGDRQ